METDARKRNGHAATSDDHSPGAEAETPPPTTAYSNVNENVGSSTDEKHKPHGLAIQILRGVSFGIYFTTCCLFICLTQFIGAPLYYYRLAYYDQYMAMTKELFGVTITTMTQWWGPTTIRISGDEDAMKEISRTMDGTNRVECNFPKRMIMMANHQIYTDWLYLWWVGYTNSPQMHGHLYIMLKEELKRIPIVGFGMQFYGFIFVARDKKVDQQRIAEKMRKLRDPRKPMWLLFFPEATNLSKNRREKSSKWAKKKGIQDPKHVLLPRHLGLQYCLQGLGDSVEYIYDCAVAYEGIPDGGYGEEIFTLSSTYFKGRPPKSVNFYWRRFKVADIPKDDEDALESWLLKVWQEKDDLLEQYAKTGRFPTPEDTPYIVTEVKTNSSFEFLKVFAIPWLALIIYRWFMEVLAIFFWLPPFRWIF